MTTTRVRFVPRSGESWADPWPMYAALRDHDPVHHGRQILTFAHGAHHWVPPPRG
ncbi:hypothetical protein [Nocardioides acrostichi]|uniref:hypothetical protein n=1 Tax=Nocardioides acrostichi TaxID=2784339 RepID=UPI001A9CA716|nr:hypothetical protein [Nocardioides acrostichi]